MAAILGGDLTTRISMGRWDGCFPRAQSVASLQSTHLLCKLNPDEMAPRIPPESVSDPYISWEWHLYRDRTVPKKDFGEGWRF